jgi:predicted phosphodiesterase
MHRMLIASPLMKRLAHVPLICPRADDVIAILNNYPNVAAVLSGHSHTNYLKKRKNILYISTASLSEVPYEYRIIRGRSGGFGVTTATVSASVF